MLLQPENPGRQRRRQFLATTLAAIAATTLLFSRSFSSKPGAPTIRHVIDSLLADIPGAPFPQTVDTIKAGDPSQPVKGIVTTMFAMLRARRAAGNRSAISNNFNPISLSAERSMNGRPVNTSAMRVSRAVSCH